MEQLPYILTDAYRDALCPESETRMDQAIDRGLISLVNDQILFKNFGCLIGVPITEIDADGGTLKPFIWYSLGHTSFDLRREMRQQSRGEPKRIHYAKPVELITNRRISEVYRDRPRKDLLEHMRAAVNEILLQDPIHM